MLKKILGHTMLCKFEDQAHELQVRERVYQTVTREEQARYNVGYVELVKGGVMSIII